MTFSNRSDEVVGYTSGVFDLFHVGHLRILHNAAGLCDRLIVGVSSDELVEYKGKAPIVPFAERMEIVREVKGVSAVVPQYDMDKFAMWERLKFDIMFVGDDWHGTEKWNAIEARLLRGRCTDRLLPLHPGHLFEHDRQRTECSPACRLDNVLARRTKQSVDRGLGQEANQAYHRWAIASDVP